jgi:hypothetical protein
MGSGMLVVLVPLLVFWGILVGGLLIVSRRRTARGVSEPLSFAHFLTLGVVAAVIAVMAFYVWGEFYCRNHGCAL